MSRENREHPAPATTFPRSSSAGPNLATLDQLRAVRRRRNAPTASLRRPLPGESIAC